MNTKKGIRNRKGTLLCVITFSASGHWYVHLKNHGCYTLIDLAPDGSVTVTDHEREVEL